MIGGEQKPQANEYYNSVQVFDVTRKITYKNLQNWYSELRQNRPDIPCILVANKIDGELSQCGVWVPLGTWGG